MTLTLTLDPRSPAPAVQQIADGLRVLLVQGELSPGDMLPPVRVLARELVVHFNTVAEAYRRLEAEGWLEVRRKHGTVVRSRPSPQQADGDLDNFAAELLRLVARYRGLGITESTLAHSLREQAAKLEGYNNV
ncbi:MAG: GntR family transcriptional regulator [Gammaproteobacteria bacterium]